MAWGFLSHILLYVGKQEGYRAAGQSDHVLRILLLLEQHYSTAPS
jgi:hypothetical protein